MTSNFHDNNHLRSRAEKKVLQSLAREIKIRSLEDENRANSLVAFATTWDARLEEKDAKATIKRQNQEKYENMVLTSKLVKESRKQRLEELFKREELQYEAELHQKGLAFRRERY